MQQLIDRLTARAGRRLSLARHLYRRIRAWQRKRFLKRHSPQALFTRFYQENQWRESTTFSGPGSTLLQTAAIRHALPEIIQSLNVRSFLDIPCGDYHWMQAVELGVDEYIGADIVEALVTANQKRWGFNKGNRKRFIQLDLTSDPLPQVDLIFCRDCLVHLSFEDIFRAIGNLKTSHSTYLLTTTYADRAINRDIVTGGWRPLNLERAPFHFQPPLMLINEQCTEHDGQYADKSLGLWRIAALPMPPVS